MASWRDMFKDQNDVNEKSVVGFISFVVMVIFALADLVTGYMGKDLVISELIYNSFLWLVLGSFGISEIGKVFKKPGDNSNDSGSID